tara:strand:+ start:412 stop:576 length:165 start_codon:yes stop_codon:yes gene_type:complete
MPINALIASLRPPAGVKRDERLGVYYICASFCKDSERYKQLTKYNYNKNTQPKY